jgi:hypothetical protein
MGLLRFSLGAYHATGSQQNDFKVSRRLTSRFSRPDPFDKCSGISGENRYLEHPSDFELEG